LRIAQLRCEPRALELNRNVRWRSHRQLVEQHLRFFVGLRSVQSREFLGQRETRAKTTCVEVDRSTQAGDAFIQSSPRRLHARGEHAMSLLPGSSDSARWIGSAAASNSPNRICVSPRLAHDAGSRGTSVVALVNC
jgi:hypothetical protein